jgi:hypothetical protein
MGKVPLYSQVDVPGRRHESVNVGAGPSGKRLSISGETQQTGTELGSKLSTTPPVGTSAFTCSSAGAAGAGQNSCWTELLLAGDATR